MGKFRFEIDEWTKFKDALYIFKKEYITHHLKILGWNKIGTSRMLQMANKSIYNLIDTDQDIETTIRGKYLTSTCYLCGSSKTIEIHHIKKVNDGGSNDVDNLMTLCKSCHLKAHKILRITDEQK